MCRSVFREDAGENGRAVGGASGSRGGLAIGRRERPQTNQRDCRIAGTNGGHGTVRQMNLKACRNRIRRQTERRILEERTATVIAGQRGIRIHIGIEIGNRLHVLAGLRVGEILVVNGKQPMALRADVADLREDVARKLTLEGQVVLRGILRAQFRWELAEKQNRTIEGPIHRLIARRIQKRVGDVWFGGPILSDKGSAEERIGNAVTNAEGRFGDELLQHQLFDGIVEKSPTHAHGCLVRAAGEFGECPVFPAGTPVQTDARCEGFVVGPNQPAGNALVPGEDQASGSNPLIVASVAWAKEVACGGKLTCINRGVLAGVEALHFLADIGERCIHFPAQTVVQRHIGLQLPTVLSKEVEGRAADEFGVRRTLRIRSREAEKVVRVEVRGAGVVGAAGPEDILAVYVEIDLLVEFLVANIAAELEAVLAENLAVVIVELEGVPGLRQLAFEIIAEKALGAVEGDEGHAFKFGPEAGMNSAAKSRTSGSGAKDGAVVGYQGSVRGPGEAEGRSSRITAARSSHSIGSRGSVELGLRLAEQSKPKFIDGGGTERPGVAGVNLLYVRDDGGAEIAERAACQLEDGEGIERIVVVVVIVDGQLLVFVQNLVKANLELIAAVSGLHHILRLGTAATGPGQELLRQIDSHGIKTLRGNRGDESAAWSRGRENGIPRLRCAAGSQIQRSLTRGR